jgi:hypothetical protein
MNDKECIMRTRIGGSLALVCFAFFCASDLRALADQVFVSARSGNDTNKCGNILTPCQTFAGAVVQLTPGGEATVLDSGDYGPVTIMQALTIEAPAGVTAFVHPRFGDAITVNAGSSDTVTLRGLVLLNFGSNNGIKVNSVGTLNVENCFITGFQNTGIQMLSPGRLNVKGTDIKASGGAISIQNHSGLVQASIDHCHLDGNSVGYLAATTSPGGSTATATHTTANNNSSEGWVCGLGLSSGRDVLNLEFCEGSENVNNGLTSVSSNAQSAALYSNCVFTNNGAFGVKQLQSGSVKTRGNNTITGNASGPTSGTIGPFSPM